MTSAPPPPRLPPRTARTTAVVAAARGILLDEGWDGLTMRTLAAALGITAPSLYKHLRDKDELAALLVADGLLAMGTALHAAAAADLTAGSLLAAYRRSVLADPGVYRLATSGPLDRADLPEGLEEWAGQPFWLVTRDAHRAQALWAFAHGMAVLEVDGRFPDATVLDSTWAAGARGLG